MASRVIGSSPWRIAIIDGSHAPEAEVTRTGEGDILTGFVDADRERESIEAARREREERAAADAALERRAVEAARPRAQTDGEVELAFQDHVVGGGAYMCEAEVSTRRPVPRILFAFHPRDEATRRDRRIIQAGHQLATLATMVENTELLPEVEDRFFGDSPTPVVLVLGQRDVIRVVWTDVAGREHFFLVSEASAEGYVAQGLAPGGTGVAHRCRRMSTDG